LYPKRRIDLKSTLLPDGCLVIFDETTEWAHTVSPLGAMAWELSDGQHTTKEIVDEIIVLTAESLDKKQLEAEVLQLIAELSENGLLA